MIEKLLVANRGEIAVRAFRAANELGVRSVAVYAPEDRDSVHRLKADESYEIGVAGPAGEHLPRCRADRRRRRSRSARTASIRATASWPRARCWRTRCAQAGVAFVGPPAGVLELAGDKTRAREAARARRACPCSTGSGPWRTRAAALAAAERRRVPVVREGGDGRRRARDAVGARPGRARGGAGGGGARGGGGVRRRHGVPGARDGAGRGTSRCSCSPTPSGGIIHLFERDCSVQRRHQKVIEITPAPNLDPGLRERICAAAVADRSRGGVRERGHRRVPGRRRTASSRSSRSTRGSRSSTR